MHTTDPFDAEWMDRKDRECRVRSAARTPGCRGRSRRGFSLVELIFVLLLASILIGIAAPQVDTAKFQLRGAAQRVGTSILAAQRAAVKSQHNVIVALDTMTGALRIHRDANNDFALDDGERVRTVDLGEGIEFGRGGAPAHPLAGVGAAALEYKQDGLPALVFKRGGSAREEGGFYITTTRAARTGEYPEEARAFHVARATGRGSWYRYVSNEWRRGF